MKILIASLVLVACGDKGPPKPFTGTLTIERILEQDGQKNASAVKVCDEKWDAAVLTIESRLGPTMKTDGDELSWAAVEGDRCAYITYERGECPPAWKKPGPHVSMVEGPWAGSKSDGSLYDSCVAIATAAKR